MEFDRPATTVYPHQLVTQADFNLLPAGQGARVWSIDNAGADRRQSVPSSPIFRKLPDRSFGLFGVLVVGAGVHRKGHHQRFGRGAASCAAGRAFVMVLSCSNSSW